MNECDYPQCKYNSISYVTCRLSYETTAHYCDKHAKQLGYCAGCGYKNKLNEKGYCKGCTQMQKEALAGGWIE